MFGKLYSYFSVSLAIRFTIGLIFLLSGTGKLFSFDLFLIEINALVVKTIDLPKTFVTICVFVFLLFELLLGIALIANKEKQTILLASLAFVLLFCLINIYRVLQDPAQDCNCFGEVLKLDVLYSLFLDLGMLLGISHLLSSAGGKAVTNKTEP